MTNQQVIDAFKRGEVAHTTHLLSTGISLLSYGWWEIARWVDGKIIVRVGDSYSKTTAGEHRRIWANGKDIIEASEATPVNRGRMFI